MKRIFTFTALLACLSGLYAQSNFIVTSSAADAVLAGNFDPATYSIGSTATPRAISASIYQDLNADSLKAYIVHLASFENRNTGSDTLSATRGIGAARRWVYQSFQRFSSQQNGRLIPSYFQFDQGICGMGQHRNILAVLPGTDTANHPNYFNRRAHGQPLRYALRHGLFGRRGGRQCQWHRACDGIGPNHVSPRVPRHPCIHGHHWRRARALGQVHLPSMRIKKTCQSQPSLTTT